MLGNDLVLMRATILKILGINCEAPSSTMRRVGEARRCWSRGAKMVVASAWTRRQTVSMEQDVDLVTIVALLKANSCDGSIVPRTKWWCVVTVEAIVSTGCGQFEDTYLVCARNTSDAALSEDLGSGNAG